MSSLERAIHIAVEAHASQTDRIGQPYILHPLRVMFGGQTEDEMIVGILHDVIEDSAWTLDDLRDEGFDERLVNAVDSLSRREGESYDDFIERIARNPLAVRVKRADLTDNMNLKRLVAIDADDATRLERYLRAWHRLAP